jgi:hypothetical protein
MATKNPNEIVNLANLALVPPVLPQAKTNGGQIQSITSIVSIATDDTAASIWRIARLPSNTLLHQLTVATTAQTGSSDFDIGIAYNPDKVSGATISVNCLADALTLATASRVLDGLKDVSIANSAKELWELASLTADPKCNLDLILTANTIGTAGGTVGFKIEYKV